MPLKLDLSGIYIIKLPFNVLGKLNIKCNFFVESESSQVYPLYKFGFPYVGFFFFSKVATKILFFIS